MQYWLVKQEPEDYSWFDLVKDGQTAWTGVRNFQARNNLRSMTAGDQVFFYHSGAEKQIVGIAKVSRGAYPDPTADEGDWSAVDLAPVKVLKSPVALATLRQHPVLKNLPIVRQSRLSVSPVTLEQFKAVIDIGH